MRIYCLFRREPHSPNDMPWLVDAVDEYTINDVGTPKKYAEEAKDPNTREIVLIIRDRRVEDLFKSPEVEAKVVLSDGVAVLDGDGP